MSKVLIAAAALAGAIAASPASAAVTVLDFSGAICVGGPCGNSGTIQTTYGDGPGVDVGYGAFTYPAGAPSSTALSYWGLGYGDLDGVTWGGSNMTGYSSRITLTALPGFEISLLSFDIATYQNASSHSPVNVESLGGTGILAIDVGTLFPTHNNVAVNSGYFSDGIALNWGPDGYNVGLDNITFDVRALPGNGGVPEPATWAMLIAGFGAVGSLVRRRRAQAA